jgi:hypothetical protein
VAAPARAADSKHEIIARLIDILASSKSDIVALLEAYFDESGTHDGSPVMCIAGYLFQKDRCKELDLAWKEVLDFYNLPFFHMVDCAQGARPFDALLPDERDQAARRMIALIRAHALFGMGIAIVETDYNAVMSGMPRIDLPVDDLPIPLPGTAYSYCCWTALNAIGAWIRRGGFEGEVAYFFEAGHKHADEANQIMNRIVRVPSLRNEFRYAAHSFVPKEKARPLQTADILAWHHATDIKKIMIGKHRRKDYAALIAERDVEMKFISREQLAIMRKEMEALKLGVPAPTLITGTFGPHMFRLLAQRDNLF